MHPGAKRLATVTEENGDRHLHNMSSYNTSTCSIPPDSASSLLLFPSSAETRSPEGIRSNREMASPPCMPNGNLNRSPDPIWTGDNSVGKTQDNVHTGSKVTTINNNEVSTGRTIIKEKLPHALSTLNVDRKSVNKPRVSTSIFSSPTTEVKCSKNEDNNAHFRLQAAGRDAQIQNCQQTKTQPRKKRRKKQSIHQQYNSILQQIPEIMDRCEESVVKCEKTLAIMNKLLRTSRIENFWLRQNLQEMGPHMSQSEYNTTFMPTSGVLTPPLSKAAAAAYTPRPRVFTPKSGNVKSTTLSTETARSRSSPPAYARAPGLTSCQASRAYDKPERRPDRFIHSHTVREYTPITCTSTVPMSTPIRSSFQSSTNSFRTTHADCQLSVWPGRNRQLEKIETTDNAADPINRKGIDAATAALRRQGERGRGRLHPNVSSAYSVARSVSREETTDVTLSLSTTVALMVHRRHWIGRRRRSAKRRLYATAQSRHQIQVARVCRADSDDDTTPIGSGTSTPSERRSPSPPRGSRQKRTRSESSTSPSPQRDTRRVVPRPSSASSPTTSRATTPPRAAPPRRKQVRRVSASQYLRNGKRLRQKSSNLGQNYKLTMPKK